jgi:hypothetical protein
MRGDYIGVVDGMVRGVDCRDLIEEIVEVDPMPGQPRAQDLNLLNHFVGIGKEGIRGVSNGSCAFGPDIDR